MGLRTSCNKTFVRGSACGVMCGVRGVICGANGAKSTTETLLWCDFGDLCAESDEIC